jgi:transposase
MTAACTSNVTTQGVVLHLAFELGWTHWKLAFTVGHGQRPRQRTIRARDLWALEQEIAKAKKRFKLDSDASVVSCYEAGRDGFWLHRYLTARGIANVIVDSASIEVKRRKRRVKSDRLDADKLVNMLVRYHAGERKVWSVVWVPGVADEDQRQLHRDLQELKDERTRHINRIKGLLASQGLALEVVKETLPKWLAAARLWDGTALGVDLQRRLVREYERWQFVHRQVLDLLRERRRRLCCDATPHVAMVRRLLGLAGIGLNGAWLLVYEFFAWRKLQNRKQVGALVGLTGTPYQSGSSDREPGISKAGSRRLRKMLVELAWCWVRWQPESALSQWYALRFGPGKGPARKIGIVALARKLFIALWRYLERGEIPAGARLVDWRSKITSPKGKKQVA